MIRHQPWYNDLVLGCFNCYNKLYRLPKEPETIKSDSLLYTTRTKTIFSSVYSHQLYDTNISDKALTTIPLYQVHAKQLPSQPIPSPPSAQRA